MQYIEAVVDTASSVDIESIIIEPDRIRGMTESAEVFMLHTTKIPALEFNAIGINRISVFKSRYGLVKSTNPKYTATTHSIPVADSTEPFMFARSINMKSKKVDVDYRCANPITIRAPKKVLDVMTYVLDGVDEWIDPMTRGFQAMGEDLVKLILKDGELSFVLSDSNGDKFTFIINESCGDAKIVDDASDDFEFAYHVKVLLPILKKSSSKAIFITSNGMIKTTINNFDIYLKPVV